jgi:HEAT repeat protein
MALGRIGAKRAFEPILALLERETDGASQDYYIRAIGDLRDERGVQVLLPYLRPTNETIRGNSADLVSAAALALGTIGTGEVIGPLIGVLSKDFDWYARVGAAQALGKIKNPRSVEALQEALGDEDFRVREKAAAGLRAWGIAIPE